MTNNVYLLFLRGHLSSFKFHVIIHIFKVQKLLMTHSPHCNPQINIQIIINCTILLSIYVNDIVKVYFNIFQTENNEGAYFDV